MTDQTFWNHKNPLQEKYQILWDALVPTEGKAETIEGELLRASSRIYYDFYNNGWGNNWSGALAYLDEHLDLPRKTYMMLSTYARGKVVRKDPPEVHTRLEALSELVVNHCWPRFKSGELRPNTVDMLSLNKKSTY